MSDLKIKLAIVGVGKIVKEQHLSAIAKTNRFELIATASRNGRVDGVTAYKDVDTMLKAEPEIQAISLCMPPQYRYAAAQCALNSGVDVLLEKPPGATVCEVEQLVRLADANDCRLYTTWHSRHAPAVERAREFLHDADVVLKSVSIHWKEDVKKWHPGQEWVWQAGGLGVFDPGINGLSILSHILPIAFFVERARLLFPSNRAAPIAATVDYKTADGVSISGEFDWRIRGDEQWTIDVKTNKGQLTLSEGGVQLNLDGDVLNVSAHSEHGEYEAIYQKFAQIIVEKQHAVDLQPLKLVADSFLLGSRVVVDDFEY